MITPADLAPLLGVDQRTIRNWARDRKIPSIRTLGSKRRPGSYRFTPEHVREIRRALGLSASAPRAASSSPAKPPPTGGAA